jgi:hypothetical protein
VTIPREEGKHPSHKRTSEARPGGSGGPPPPGKKLILWHTKKANEVTRRRGYAAQAFQSSTYCCVGRITVNGGMDVN